MPFYVGSSGTLQISSPLSSRLETVHRCPFPSYPCHRWYPWLKNQKTNWSADSRRFPQKGTEADKSSVCRHQVVLVFLCVFASLREALTSLLFWGHSSVSEFKTSSHAKAQRRKEFQDRKFEQEQAERTEAFQRARFRLVEFTVVLPPGTVLPVRVWGRVVQVVDSVREPRRRHSADRDG